MGCAVSKTGPAGRRVRPKGPQGDEAPGKRRIAFADDGSQSQGPRASPRQTAVLDVSGSPGPHLGDMSSSSAFPSSKEEPEIRMSMVRTTTWVAEKTGDGAQRFQMGLASVSSQRRMSKARQFEGSKRQWRSFGGSSTARPSPLMRSGSGGLVMGHMQVGGSAGSTDVAPTSAADELRASSAHTARGLVSSRLLELIDGREVTMSPAELRAKRDGLRLARPPVMAVAAKGPPDKRDGSSSSSSRVSREAEDVLGLRKRAKQLEAEQHISSSPRTPRGRSFTEGEDGLAHTPLTKSDSALAMGQGVGGVGSSTFASTAGAATAGRDRSPRTHVAALRKSRSERPRRVTARYLRSGARILGIGEAARSSRQQPANAGMPYRSASSRTLTQSIARERTISVGAAQVDVPSHEVSTPVSTRSDGSLSFAGSAGELRSDQVVGKSSVTYPGGSPSLDKLVVPELRHTSGAPGIASPTTPREPLSVVSNASMDSRGSWNGLVIRDEVGMVELTRGESDNSGDQ